MNLVVRLKFLFIKLPTFINFSKNHNVFYLDYQIKVNFRILFNIKIVYFNHFTTIILFNN